MAEGGEGEEEIQFLRTVSPAFFRGGLNLHLLLDDDDDDDEELSEVRPNMFQHPS